MVSGRRFDSVLAPVNRIAAQTVGDAAKSETATTLITLGTRGGPLPTKDRAQSSNLLVVNGMLYVIDAGDGVTRRIVQAGYDFRKVGKIFITHAYDDHTAGLATLLTSEWEFQRAEPIDIYGSGVETLVKGAIDISRQMPKSAGRKVKNDRWPTSSTAMM